MHLSPVISRRGQIEPRSCVQRLTARGERGLMANNPSFFSSCGDDCPVETVNWYEAVAYANAQSEEEGLEECYELSGCTNRVGEGMECSSVIELAIPPHTAGSEFERTVDLAGSKLMERSPLHSCVFVGQRKGRSVLKSGHPCFSLTDPRAVAARSVDGVEDAGDI